MSWPTITTNSRPSGCCRTRARLHRLETGADSRRHHHVLQPDGTSSDLAHLEGDVTTLVNDQKFSKTAHCWGVENNEKGTNTNRIVLLRKAY